MGCASARIYAKIDAMCYIPVRRDHICMLCILPITALHTSEAVNVDYQLDSMVNMSHEQSVDRCMHVLHGHHQTIWLL
jgi:hypothetical protein